jgi:type IV pilus assembly protein PilB
MSKPPTSAPASSAAPTAPARSPADGAASRNGGGQPAQRTQVRGVPLGEALIRLGFVRAEDVEAALARQATDRRKLGEILVAGGKVTKDQIDRAMALQMGMGVFNTADGVDPSVVSLIDDRTARRYQAVPVRFDADGMLVVAMVDPTNLHAVDDLQILTGHTIRPARASAEELQQLLSSTQRLDDIVGEVEAEEIGSIEDIREAIDDAPVVRLVNWVISQAVDVGASDIHLEPQAANMHVRFRVDGVLREITQIPRQLQNGVVSRIKIMADLDIAERRVPQDGRVGLTVGGRTLDLRVASLPTVFGEKIVIRVLDKSNVLLRLPDLGFEPDVLSAYERAYRRPYGAVVITGPTGSGKSTSLYATLNQLNDTEKNIITVEDPVEYRLQGINQVQVNVKAGLTFASGLRSILRCDPDIVMIGEVRDRETAQIAVEAALTGHLVLCTLHTNDSAGALPRLSEMGVEPFLSASAVIGILAQRLARKLCPDCRKQTMVPHALLMEVAETRTLPRGLPDPAPIFEAAGCPRCNGTGYKGRVGVYEFLSMSETVQRLTLEGASAAEISIQARREGMRTLREDGLIKVLSGRTTIEELARVVA